MTNRYVENLSVVLKKYENKDEAEKMSQYMRGQFSYFGLRAPQMKDVTKNYIKEFGFPSSEDIPIVMKQMYSLDQRELQIIALAIMDHKLKKDPDISDIEILEYIITTKSWWDTVDHIAANQVGTYFRKFPEHVEEYVEKWLESDNIWLIRTSILYQLKYKQETNFQYLKEIILRSAGTKEFFINKAIGWALREYSKIDGEAVISFINEYNERLSNLSIREGLKWLKSKNLV
ncbi:DNA alkylation repair protein [Bacillus suaedaesalsae]|uniref:DNA alkylation repair protein n=1 Tax=Bacillus suaedaesalsae TaxID=2810349 RepID=A0ABS2DM12_9BACI|nr:DNA alkylation repair protein [Bacillus suaedaesalsae]MBM6619392.1 DNA alkylation repair protein [Bacillus suaedaesalsae]